ncbi:hypothetical protein D9615_008361 [Tricholomella constricta]|uniref:TPR domain protein n=1 Tax=Tricholomella constricta TaxID=117010 RepID=A0A8H5HDJ6_9AGAR|nr:hypothetical protein D9615_008361 [Tricholomella constricta]
MNRKLSLNRLGAASRLCSLSRRPQTPCQVLRTAPRIQTNSYSQQSPQAETLAPHRRIPSLLTLLLLAGVGVIAYGIYDIYGMMTLWPPEVRTDLRGGLKAKNKGDLKLSEQYLRRAWETSKTLPIELFKKEPYLKTSGIAVLLASVLEAEGKPEKAYDVYLDALTRLQQVGTKDQLLSGPEKLRAIAISYKLAEMAGDLERPEEEERHLVWAVEAILRSVLRMGEQTMQLEHVSEADTAVPSDTDTRTMISELTLPDWATKTDVAAPLEALGAVYAQAGRLDYAMPLYLQAISILMPPAPQQSSDEDRCRGAQLMSNLSELIIRSQPKVTDEILHQAEAWATKGLEITMHAKETASTPNPTCELAFAVALFNVAAMRRMAGDKEEAKKLFSLSLKQSRAVGLQSGIQHAEDALRQLGVSVDPPPSSKP